MRLSPSLLSGCWLLLLTPPRLAAGPADAWQPLFNGTDLSGWTVKARPADLAKGFWRVEDGAIVADSTGAKGHDYVWLCSNREYRDFALKIRFKDICVKDLSAPDKTGEER